MSDSPKQGSEQAVPDNSTQSSTKHDLAEFFRCRPIAFANELLTEIEKRDSSKTKRDYVTNLIRRTVIFFCRKSLFLWAAAMVFTASYLGTLYVGDRLNAEWVMAIFTAVLAWLAYFQWSITVNQLEHMRIEQRAWLGVADSGIQKIVLGFPISGYVQFKNTGSTPAKIIHMVGYVELKKDGNIPRPTDFEESSLINEPSRNAIPPSGFQVLSATSEFKLDDVIKEAIDKEIVRVWLGGWVFYRDVFSNKVRKTEFCMRWFPHENVLQYQDDRNNMT
jgi:hypothetical protein